MLMLCDDLIFWQIFRNNNSIFEIIIPEKFFYYMLCLNKKEFQKEWKSKNTVYLCLLEVVLYLSVARAIHCFVGNIFVLCYLYYFDPIELLLDSLFLFSIDLISNINKCISINVKNNEIFMNLFSIHVRHYLIVFGLSNNKWKVHFLLSY